MDLSTILSTVTLVGAVLIAISNTVQFIDRQRLKEDKRKLERVLEDTEEQAKAFRDRHVEILNEQGRKRRDLQEALDDVKRELRWQQAMHQEYMVEHGPESQRSKARKRAGKRHKSAETITLASLQALASCEGVKAEDVERIAQQGWDHLSGLEGLEDLEELQDTPTIFGFSREEHAKMCAAVLMHRSDFLEK